MAKVKLSNLMVVVDKDGFIQVKPWSKCTKKEKEADSTVQLDDLISHSSHEFGITTKDIKPWMIK